MLLNLTGIVLVAVLGFLPLMIVHFADRRPKLLKPRVPRAVLQALIALKTIVLVDITDWLLAIAL